MRIPFEEVERQSKKAMLNAGLSEEQASICAKTHTESSRDGVYSHGLNRVPRFISFVEKGWVNLAGKPLCMRSMGALEQYDGEQGIGIINAKFAMNRAVDLARVHGMGLVTLRNTTHWMRGGTYAWDAANAGFMSMCWTNTESCMPVWGAKSLSVGNNPFCMGIPYESGHVVLDMAMSQYAYGKLEVMRLAGEELPYPGGYDEEGNLTCDPGAIEKTHRVLPIGYWKGSSMAILLDLAAALLSDGMTGAEQDRTGTGSCSECCQIFLAFHPATFGSAEDMKMRMEDTIAHIHGAVPVKEGGKISYPGENTLLKRRESEEIGVLVDETIWAEVCELAK